MKRVISYINEKVETFNNSYLFSKLSMVKDYIFAAAKIIFGMFVASYFFIVSGLYSICVGLSKRSFFIGKEINESFEGNRANIISNEYKHLAKIAFFILIGSVVYVIYMARLFFISSNFYYGEIPAVTIAAISFTELTLSIINLKKSKGILNTGLRCVNLTSAFTAMVLAQIAILSFADNTDSFLYNAIIGTLFGGLCIVVAIIMFIYYFTYKRSLSRNRPKMNNQRNYTYVKRKLKN